MVNQTDFSVQMSVGSTDMSALRRAARDNSPEALKAVAQQFEALLVNMMLKSMREASPKGGLFENDQTKLYTSLYDQQISQSFAKRGMGLADALVRQLSAGQSSPALQEKSEGGSATGSVKQALLDTLQSQPTSGTTSLALLKLNEVALAEYGKNSPAINSESTSLAFSDELGGLLAKAIRDKQDLLPSTGQEKTSNQSTSLSSSLSGSKPAHVKAFHSKLAKHAEEASRATGIPAKFMLGQAALESGWGKHVMSGADGTSSHNLFGIKATKGWTGKTVETTTTEYVNGVAYRKKEKFRAYDSYADSFKDYARLLKSNPRYQNVLANSRDATSFAQGLQRAGYATDPQYAAKLTRIIQKSLST